MADWDADDFEPDTAAPTAGVATIPSDKWDGEDEEDDIKVLHCFDHTRAWNGLEMFREYYNKVDRVFRMPGMPSQTKTTPRSPRSPSQ